MADRYDAGLRPKGRGAGAAQQMRERATVDSVLISSIPLLFIWMLRKPMESSVTTRFTHHEIGGTE
jgi:hypothetical protein